MSQDIDVFVNDKRVRKIAHNGKVFILAKEGQEYEVRLSNNSTNRVLGVCSIDGLNVIDGKVASPTGTGYIINGYGSYRVKGFRTSDNEVHPFIFSKKARSYAANSEETDFSAQDCGVIGVVFHSEKYKPKPRPKVIEKIIERPVPYYPSWPTWPQYPWYHGITYTTCSNGTTATSPSLNNVKGGLSDPTSATLRCSSLNASNLSDTTSVSFASTPEFDLGTEFSDDAVEDRVRTVDFEIGYELSRFEIYYASRDQLLAMGVPLQAESAVAFPTAFHDKGYCKPPRKSS